jgi:hypothetical protein
MESTLAYMEALGCQFAGIWILIKWNNEKWNHVFVITHDDDHLNLGYHDNLGM